MNLSIKLPPNKCLDKSLLRGVGDRCFEQYCETNMTDVDDGKTGHYDNTFKKPEWKGEIVEKFLSGAGMEL